jgi:hypothetical protein
MIANTDHKIYDILKSSYSSHDILKSSYSSLRNKNYKNVCPIKYTKYHMNLDIWFNFSVVVNIERKAVLCCSYLVQEDIMTDNCHVFLWGVKETYCL